MLLNKIYWKFFSVLILYTEFSDFNSCIQVVVNWLSLNNFTIPKKITIPLFIGFIFVSFRQLLLANIRLSSNKNGKYNITVLVYPMDYLS